MKKIWYISFGIALLTFCALKLDAQEYWRVVGNEQIKNMNTFERTQYTKALKLLNDRQYRAAASEFERFLIQFNTAKDSMPYIIFMRAFSLHMAKDRNKAISIYNEVLDFYPDVIDAAAPALYYRGIAQFENGDYAKGMQSMKELLDDEDYSKAPVGANASIRMAENHWKNKEFDRAERYLKQTVRDFMDSAPRSAENARNLYAAYSLCTGKHQDYARWYVEAYKEKAEKEQKQPAKVRVDMVNNAYNIVIWNWHGYFQDSMIMKYRGGKKGSDPGKELWALMKENKDAYMSSASEWDFYNRAIRLLAPREKLVQPSEFEKIVQETITFIAKTADDEKSVGRQQNRYIEITNMLIDGYRLGDASVANGRIADKKIAVWNDYRIIERQEKWTDALKSLETAMSTFTDDAEFLAKCNWSKAHILKDRFKNYDDAIKTYQAIGKPQDTLWYIADCHFRKDDLSATMKTLIEMENAFPDNGPEAAWRRATYQERARNSDQAIKEARYIMKKYPKSQQSSYAHQLLERYGIDTGGAVAD